MQCVVLAGGLATRMRPITEKIPKLNIPVGGRPFGHIQLDWMSRHGVTDVVYCIGYRGEMVRELLGDGSKWGVRVRYVDEGADLKGTGGALRLAADQGVLAERFLVTYGDSYLPVDFTPIWQSFEKSGKSALMTVFRNKDLWDKSNACVEGGLVTLYDKNVRPKPAAMQWIDWGLCGVSLQSVRDRIPSGQKADLADLLRDLSHEGQLAAYEVRQRFYEIGSPSGLAELEAFLAR